jgi:signal transduction histidine kinase
MIWEDMDKERIDILLVDDTPANLMSMEELLASPGLNFVKCASGEEALEKVLVLQPALILLDVQMPGMDGFEVARLLRSTQRTKAIPIIFVTATQRDERLTFRGFESGAVDYLFKPLNPAILRSKVDVFVELHRSRMDLERAVRDLSLTNRELESFSYSVSHDLRAPLRSIMGFTEIALEKAGGEQKENLQRVMNAGKRMGDLIEGLLDMARVTRVELLNGPVDLSEMAAQICRELGSEDDRKNVVTSVEENVKTVGDRRLLENVMRNLLANAFKFTRKAQDPRIEFGTVRKDSETAYFVRDNGAGFDMSRAQMLFGAFQRLHSQSDFPGTGVGLATVQRIVHRHGGKIWAESAPGRQTTFYFTLR